MALKSDSDYLKKVLEYFYGYQEFRPGQEPIIQAILQQEPVLAVLPTGAGKSLCFQLPSLLMEGVTLVISPLISLMKDQAQSLTQRQLPAAYLDSSMSGNAYGRVLYEVLQGRCKFLYVAPERLASQQFINFAQRANITLVAVDEAHCVSQWGRSFRKDYYNIPAFIKALPKRPLVAAFTASATPEVREDILLRLEIPKAKVFVKDFDRPNLFFAVKRTMDKDRELRAFLAKHEEEPGIVYCSTRNTVEQVTGDLQGLGYNALRYHAGLTAQERSANQDAFVQGRAQLIVATNAFGMGIDKPDVRFVVHYNMPKDMESYYQEAGRAGRDGKPSECLLLYNKQDVIINTYLIENSEADSLSRTEQLERLEEMDYYCKTMKCLRKSLLEYFGEKPPATCNNCGNCRDNKAASWRRFL